LEYQNIIVSFRSYPNTSSMKSNAARVLTASMLLEAEHDGRWDCQKNHRKVLYIVCCHGWIHIKFVPKTFDSFYCIWRTKRYWQK